MHLPSRPPVRALLGTALAAAALAVLVPWNLKYPELALQTTVASALATDDRLLKVALEQYPDRAPAIAITYGHLDLFREQLARFGPQVVPIVAAYQNSFTTADALRFAGQAIESARKQLAGDPGARDLAPITAEDRGLIALLNMREEGNAFVGQWEITDNGEARRIPSRLLTLAGPELLIGGLTALERRVLQERESTGGATASLRSTSRRSRPGSACCVWRRRQRAGCDRSLAPARPPCSRAPATSARFLESRP